MNPNMFIHWATTGSISWQPFNIHNWGSIKFAEEPKTGDVVSAKKEWIFALNREGVIFSGYDHYHCVNEGGDCVVTAWKDDPGDYSPGEFYARVARFKPYTPDFKLRGKLKGHLNTRQSFKLYAGMQSYKKLVEAGPVQNTELFHWDEFAVPAGNIGHGIWVPDNQIVKHEKILVDAHSWRHWLNV